MYETVTYPTITYPTSTCPSSTLSTRLPLFVREQNANTTDAANVADSASAANTAEAANAAADFWGEPIHVYTRQQALEDGVLVDASSGDLAEVSFQHFGPKAHVAMTAALHALIERAVTNPKTWNDWKGVWHDVCWMSTAWQVKRHKTEYSITVWFEVTITGAGRKRKHLLKRHMQPDGMGGVEITFMLPDED